MRILVFEFMVGGGVADQHPLADELVTFYQQGHAMLKAVCEDLLQLGHEVFVPVDVHADTFLPHSKAVRISVESESEVDPTLFGAGAAVDKLLLIAPETDGCLKHFADLLSTFADKFLGPDADFITRTADKWQCHSWLIKNNIPSPESKLWTEHCDVVALPEEFEFPCVAKPIDGAGSEEVRLVSSVDDLGTVLKPILLQRFVAGTAVSVSVIVESPEKVHYLEPGRQIFDAEPFGIHIRTEYPLETSLRERALKLAERVVDASPNVVGYFGIDMVLGEDPANDVVIEINPRLTTSYCFLRERSQDNLAKLFPI